MIETNLLRNWTKTVAREFDEAAAELILSREQFEDAFDPEDIAKAIADGIDQLEAVQGSVAILLEKLKEKDGSYGKNEVDGGSTGEREAGIRD